MAMPALWWASSTFSTVIGQRPAQVGPLLPSNVRASPAASSGGYTWVCHSMITPAGSVGAPVWPPASCRVNHASALPTDARRRAAGRALSQASDRRRRREEATAGAGGLLAAAVLAVAADLDLPARNGAAELVQEVPPRSEEHTSE